MLEDIDDPKRKQKPLHGLRFFGQKFRKNAICPPEFQLRSNGKSTCIKKNISLDRERFSNPSCISLFSRPISSRRIKIGEVGIERYKTSRASVERLEKEVDLSALKIEDLMIQYYSFKTSVLCDNFLSALLLATIRPILRD